MNKKEALKKFEAELKEREEFIQNIRNGKIRLFKVTCLYDGKTNYFVASKTLEELEEMIKKTNAEVATWFKGATRKRVANRKFEVELIKEA